MARTISEIQQTLLDAVTADSTLSTSLTSTSKVAIWRLWTYIVAFCQWTLETLFDQHKNEVETLLAEQRAHTLQWYVNKAKEFQYGYSLTLETDSYSTIDETAQVVNYAAAEEIPKGIRLKVATESGGDLAPLNTAQRTAFTAYMEEVRDAGVRMYIVSEVPDTLKLTLNIYYNALVLDADGKRLDGTNDTPVQDAITAFLQNLPFNGLFVINKLIDSLQAIDGVILAQVSDAQATYAALPYCSISVEYQPDAGYLRIYDPATDLTINFTPHVPI